MSADFCSLLPRQVALPTEAWQGAEICRRSAEKGYINLPGPLNDLISKIAFAQWYSTAWMGKNVK